MFDLPFERYSSMVFIIVLFQIIINNELVYLSHKCIYCIEHRWVATYLYVGIYYMYIDLLMYYAGNIRHLTKYIKFKAFNQ